MDYIRKSLAHLHPQLVDEILENSAVQSFSKGTLLLSEGQYVKVIPFVVSGLIKVFSSFNERELLLYYIEANESCIMSFSAGLKNEPGKVFAVVEEDALIILMPVERVLKWVKLFPDINTLFYQQFNRRYTDLLDTISHVLFNKLDKRLYDFLNKRARLTRQNPIKLTHVQIAAELGTAREVVSRVMKKLENEGKVKQHLNGIEII